MKGAAVFALMVALAGCTDSTGPSITAATSGATPTTVVPITAIPDVSTPPAVSTTTVTTTAPKPSTTTAPDPGSAATGEPWGSVEGLVMFRGNPSRTYYGAGPAPRDPAMLWRFPDEPMCGHSPVGSQDQVWCGSGWTGQPVVWDRPDGVTEVIFGAYDKHIHFLDAVTGTRTRPDFPMGDIIKGSVSLDPDGFPLLYAGSRDPDYRVIALDRDEPVELWSLSASSVPGMWNNDWDSNGVVIDDVLFEGGENSWWFAVKLNRGYDAAGQVTVDPAVLWSTPAFTDDLVGAVGRQQSIESSTAVFGDTAYFTNSAGRVVGVDISHISSGEAEIVFDFWMGDDVDATLVIDGEGMLYVAAEVDLRTARADEVGQLVKLDPSRPQDAIVWSVEVAGTGVDGGLWATPALHGGVLYAATNPGELLAVDAATGDVLWRDDIGAHAWSSPVVVEDTLIVAVDCDTAAALRGYDVSVPAAPSQLWELAMTGGCIESTPAVWKGNLYVGSRDGFFYAAGD